MEVAFLKYFNQAQSKIHIIFFSRDFLSARKIHAGSRSVYESVVVWVFKMHALEFPLVGRTVATFVPIDVFRCGCVSAGWRERWSHEDLYLPSFVLDLSGCTIRVCSWRGLAQRIPANCTSLDLNFSCCRIAEQSVAALARRVWAMYKRGLRLRGALY